LPTGREHRKTSRQSTVSSPKTVRHELTISSSESRNVASSSATRRNKVGPVPTSGLTCGSFPYGRSVIIAHGIVENTVEVLRVFYGGQDYETIMTGDRDAD
jgi:hypothetical protein